MNLKQTCLNPSIPAASQHASDVLACIPKSSVEQDCFEKDPKALAQCALW